METERMTWFFILPIVYFRFGWGVSGDCTDEDDLDGDR